MLKRLDAVDGAEKSARVTETRVAWPVKLAAGQPVN